MLIILKQIHIHGAIHGKTKWGLVHTMKYYSANKKEWSTDLCYSMGEP